MKKMNVLVVEDETIISKDIQERLKSMGHNVVGVAMTGEDAVKMAMEKNPDLVLMDIQLKGKLDGIGAVKEVRKKMDIPIIYLTAYANMQIMERVKETEPFNYIVKPFEEEELRTAIEIALQNHGIKKKLKKEEAVKIF